MAVPPMPCTTCPVGVLLVTSACCQLGAARLLMCLELLTLALAKAHSSSVWSHSVHVWGNRCAHCFSCGCIQQIVQLRPVQIATSWWGQSPSTPTEPLMCKCYYTRYKSSDCFWCGYMYMYLLVVTVSIVHVQYVHKIACTYIHLDICHCTTLGFAIWWNRGWYSSLNSVSTCRSL